MFDALKSSMFLLDTDASLFTVGGVLNQIQDNWEVVRQTESPAGSAPVLCYSPGNACHCYDVQPFSFVPSWCSAYLIHRPPVHLVVQKFRNSDGMLAWWYLLLAQFSVLSMSDPMQLFGMFGVQVPVSSSGSDGTRFGWSPVGQSSYGYFGNRFVLVIVECFSRWTEACPLPKQDGSCRRRCICPVDHLSIRYAGGNPFGSGPRIKQFNRTLLMKVAMFLREHSNDWDDLLPAVMIAYRSSGHKSTGFSPYHLMFVKGSTIPIDTGLPLRNTEAADPIQNPTLSGYETLLNWLTTKCVPTQVRLCSDRNDFMISGL